MIYMNPQYDLAALIARERHQQLLNEAAERRLGKIARLGTFGRGRRRHHRWT